MDARAGGYLSYWYISLFFENSGLSLLILNMLYCSWELAPALKEAKARFESADVKLIAIGVGGPEKARILAERVITVSIIMNSLRRVRACKFIMYNPICDYP